MTDPAMEEPALLYSYHPRKDIIISSVFALITGGLAAFLLTKRIWPLAILMAALFIWNIWGILKASYIEVWLKTPFAIYKSRSLLRRREVELSCVSVSGAERRIVSMWKGNIREKLVFTSGDKEYLLHPFFSEGSPLIEKAYQAMHTIRAEGEYHRQQQKAKLKAAIEKRTRQIQKKVKKTVWAMIEMSIQCHRCEGHIPVNGPWTDLVCPECFENTEFSPENWIDLLEDVRNEIVNELSDGEGTKSSIMGVFNTALFYGRLKPYCPECKQDFNMKKDHGEDKDSLVCSSCGFEVPVMYPPEWFQKVFKGANLIVGATRSTRQSDETPEPVLITCPSCSATFKTTGQSRNAPCPHCDNSLFIPDDLWFHFHPVPVKKRWFVGFTAMVKYSDS